MLKHKLFIWNRSNHYGCIPNAVIGLFLISTIHVVNHLDILFVSAFISLILSYYTFLMIWQVLLNVLNHEFLPNLKDRNNHVYERVIIPASRTVRKDVTDE